MIIEPKGTVTRVPTSLYEAYLAQVLKRADIKNPEARAFGLAVDLIKKEQFKLELGATIPEFRFKEYDFEINGEFGDIKSSWGEYFTASDEEYAEIRKAEKAGLRFWYVFYENNLESMSTTCLGTVDAVWARDQGYIQGSNFGGRRIQKSQILPYLK